MAEINPSGAEGRARALEARVRQVFPGAQIRFQEGDAGAPVALVGYAPGLAPARAELMEDGQLSIWVNETDMGAWQKYLKSRQCQDE